MEIDEQEMEGQSRADARESQEEPRQFGDPSEPGPLLTGKPHQVRRVIEKAWDALKDKYQRWQVEWEVNERRRQGESNVWAIEKVEDRGLFQVYVPPGRSKIPPAMFNKASRLARRVVSQMYTDPPAPDPVPSTGEEADRDAAEFAGRVLMDVQGESGINAIEQHKEALSISLSARAAFIEYDMDPTAGGRQPIEIQAHPASTHISNALETVDPETGLLGPADPSTLKTRYVRSDGTLTDTPSEAALRWMPKLQARVRHPSAVRFMPWTASDIWEAEGVIVAEYVTWREIANQFPDALPSGGNTEEDAAIAKAVDYRPSGFSGLLPKKGRKPHDPKPDDVRDRLVLVQRVWVKECRDYPDGAYVVLVGGEFIGTRGDWITSRDDRRVALDLPLTQHGRLDRDNLMDWLGMAQEMRAHIVGVVEDILDQNANRKRYIPTNSILQSKAHLLPAMTWIPINPGGAPVMEELIPVPPETGTLLQFVDRDMDDASDLQEAGQGLQSPNVTSGRQALTIVSQVQAGMSDLRQQEERAYLRASRIQLQLLAARQTVPQLIRYQGNDGVYKVRRWLGSDLGSTRDVRLKQGTMTMMAPLQKANLALQYSQFGAIPPDTLQDVLRSGVGGTIGLQDDPHLMRVRRQIAAWESGPDQAYVQAVNAFQQAQAAVAQQPPQLGALSPALPPPPPAPPAFQPVPADGLPGVATIRLRELAKAMATTIYEQSDPVWRGVLDGMFAAAQQVIAQAQQAAQPPQSTSQAPGQGSVPEPGQGPQLTPGEAGLAA